MEKTIEAGTPFLNDNYSHILIICLFLLQWDSFAFNQDFSRPAVFILKK
jgi:hypothetical protein